MTPQGMKSEDMMSKGMTPPPAMTRRDFVAVLWLAALGAGCAASGAGRTGLREAGAFRQSSFYDTGTGGRIGRRRLFQRMTSAPIVLLGEVHDNVSHHRMRGSLLIDWVASEPSREAAIVFEHLDREYNDALRLVQRRAEGAPGSRDRSAGHGRPGLDELLEAGRFDRKAWGWPAHQPLFEAAHASGATWIAANFSRGAARRLSRDQAAPVDPALQAVLESARWSAQAQQALDDALIRGHCNQLPPAALPGMARIQRLRDAALALPLLDGAERRSLLLAGNGHVRRDHGVPRYLGALEAEALVIGFEEADAAAPAAGDSAASELVAAVGTERAAAFGRAYDAVCLTTTSRRQDPCADLGPINPAAPTQTPSR